jgi:hypothetical protein
MMRSSTTRHTGKIAKGLSMPIIFLCRKKAAEVPESLRSLCIHCYFALDLTV